MNQLGESDVIVNTVFLALATVFVAARFISRMYIVHRVSVSDYAMLIGWVLVSGLSAANIYATTKGLGLREGVLESWRDPLARAEYVFGVLYYPALAAIKLSILLFYLMLIKEEFVFRLATYITLWVVLLAGFALTLVNLFPCRPLSASFQITTPPGTYCIDIVALYISTATIDIITDVAIVSLPMPVLWRVRLPRRQKVILLLTFGTGVFVIVISVLRTEFLLQKAIQRATKAQPPSVHDLSYYDAYVFLWSALELTLGIMCGCVPMLKPLIGRLLPRLLYSSSLASQRTEHEPFALSEDAAPPSPRESTPAIPLSSMDQIPHQQAFLSTSGGGPVSPPPEFVRIAGSKNILAMSGRESMMPLAAIFTIFLLWGFAYGIIITFYWELSQASHRSQDVSFALHATFFGAYLFGPILVAKPSLQRWGFKITVVAGLSIFGCGMLLFWPATVLVSLPELFIASFVAGLGISVLETSVDLFVALCGPQGQGGIRLSIARGIQAVGWAVSPIFAQQVLFKHTTSASALVTVQWIFLVHAIVPLMLVVMFSLLPLPEVSDEELNELAEQCQQDIAPFVCGVHVAWITLVLAFLAQFCTIGSQEASHTNFKSLVIFNVPYPHPPVYGFTAIRCSAFAAGCFVTALGLCFVKPRQVLLILYLCAIIFSVLTMMIEGYSGIVMAIVVSFFSAGIFPITFVIGIHGMGRHTKSAAAILTTAATGGALFPSIQNIISVSHGYRYGFCIEVALFSAGSLFSCYLNFVPAARKQAATATHNLDRG
ncbi:hypothetical protein CNMCM6936_002362 [Aspergillus lentulus]|uniref:Rhodopsin domain-containing protein n=1 Tax=Aspergillus lentulus TaxID=293939 RepID=A0AAN5YT59_ASPLE|nr:hypothetical protein CNMCM6069_007901 [Aspergillus lentulus]KAF4162262.1 hypothetical protein CNMCM6936_002362 [Aspergillus lentulus]KAF4188540.1 hypothetical protein CNMCM7927_001235 [Aspergillus lentulus]KAF4206948.1 hypothetical protein CNMCM8927_004043 [Aspergillus lentulus]